MFEYIDYGKQFSDWVQDEKKIGLAAKEVELRKQEGERRNRLADIQIEKYEKEKEVDEDIAKGVTSISSVRNLEDVAEGYRGLASYAASKGHGNKAMELMTQAISLQDRVETRKHQQLANENLRFELIGKMEKDIRATLYTAGSEAAKAKLENYRTGFPGIIPDSLKLPDVPWGPYIDERTNLASFDGYNWVKVDSKEHKELEKQQLEKTKAENQEWRESKAYREEKRGLDTQKERASIDLIKAQTAHNLASAKEANALAEKRAQEAKTSKEKDTIALQRQKDMDAEIRKLEDIKKYTYTKTERDKLDKDISNLKAERDRFFRNIGRTDLITSSGEGEVIRKEGVDGNMYIKDSTGQWKKETE